MIKTDREARAALTGGDKVLLYRSSYSGESVEKAVVARTTRTQILVGTLRFYKASGYVVGRSTARLWIPDGIDHQRHLRGKELIELRAQRLRRTSRLARRFNDCMERDDSLALTEDALGRLEGLLNGRVIASRDELATSNRQVAAAVRTRRSA